MSLEKPKLFDKVAWIESLNTKEFIQKSFEEERSFIESSCGIKLTQIELVGLYRITVKVMQETYQQKKTYAQEKIAGKKKNLCRT